MDFLRIICPDESEDLDLKKSSNLLFTASLILLEGHSI